MAPIPHDLYRGAWIPVRFIVVDTEGRRHVKDMGIWPSPKWPPVPSGPPMEAPVNDGQDDEDDDRSPMRR